MGQSEHPPPTLEPGTFDGEVSAVLDQYLAGELTSVELVREVDALAARVSHGSTPAEQRARVEALEHAASVVTEAIKPPQRSAPARRPKGR